MAASTCHCAATSILHSCCLNCCAEQSHNVHGTIVEKQLMQKKSSFQVQLHLPTLDLFWANFRVQHHLPPLDLARTCKSVWLLHESPTHLPSFNRAWTLTCELVCSWILTSSYLHRVTLGWQEMHTYQHLTNKPKFQAHYIQKQYRAGLGCCLLLIFFLDLDSPCCRIWSFCLKGWKGDHPTPLHCCGTHWCTLMQT